MQINKFNQTQISYPKTGVVKSDKLLHGDKDEVILGNTDVSELPASNLHAMAKHHAIKDMYKVDLHRHLEGSFTPEMIIKIAQKYNIALPTYDPEALRPHVQVTPEDKSLTDFLKKFEILGKLFVSKEALKDLTYEVVKEAAKDNVKYLELRFCPLTMAGCKPGVPPKLDPEKDVMEGVMAGINEAAGSFGITVSPILITSRKLGLEGAMKTLDIADKYDINSIDLAGDESKYPSADFIPFFKEATKRNKLKTGHGSEAAGPESAHVLMTEGDVDRVGHGTRIFEDPAVEKLAAEEQKVLEMCPTSNEQTFAIKSFDRENFPFDRYDKEGIKVTINTDDPGVCGVTLTGENERVMDLYDYSVEKMQEINLRALDAGFIPQQIKEFLKQTFMENYRQINAALSKSRN